MDTEIAHSLLDLSRKVEARGAGGVTATSLEISDDQRSGEWNSVEGVMFAVLVFDAAW